MFPLCVCFYEVRLKKGGQRFYVVIVLVSSFSLFTLSLFQDSAAESASEENKSMEITQKIGMVFSFKPTLFFLAALGLFFVPSVEAYAKPNTIIFCVYHFFILDTLFIFDEKKTCWL